MSETKQSLDVHVNVEITVESLRTIVENAKKIAGSDEKGFYHLDTADAVGQMISRFLSEYDFESYVKDIEHYRR
jgi:hypothetical protein